MIDPRGMGVIDWTDRMAQLLPFPANKLVDPELWRGWARYIQSYPVVSVFNPPSPDSFEDWREWAMRFNQVVEL